MVGGGGDAAAMSEQLSERFEHHGFRAEEEEESVNQAAEVGSNISSAVD